MIATRERRAYPKFDFKCGSAGALEVSGGSSRLVSEGFYFIDDDRVSLALLRSIPAELADFFDIAVAVYLADRLARRPSERSGPEVQWWQRRIQATVPVRCISKWTDASVARSIRDALEYMTEDVWDIRFTARNAIDRRPAEYANFLFEEPLTNPVVGLFSGGLDSLAGAVSDLANFPGSHLVLVSANTSGRVVPYQRELVDALRTRTHRPIHWVPVRFGLRRRKKGAYEKEERTQRTRGFVFIAAGAVVAAVAGAKSLQLYENGVGAINLPYFEGQLGAQSTRAMHPAAVQLMQQLVSKVTGDDFELRLANLFRTKSEMCIDLRVSGFADIATRTISCDGFPQRVRGAHQCGTCTSCLLRRQSLRSAGIEDNRGDEFGYRFNAFAALDRLSPERRLPLDAMLGQARRITRSLEEADAWHGFVREFPTLLELPESLLTERSQRALLEMFGRYAREFERVFDGT